MRWLTHTYPCLFLHRFILLLFILGFILKLKYFSSRSAKALATANKGGLRCRNVQGFSPVSCTLFLYSWESSYISITQTQIKVSWPACRMFPSVMQPVSRWAERGRVWSGSQQTVGQREDQQSSAALTIDTESTPTERKQRWREVKKVKEDRKTQPDKKGGWEPGRRNRSISFIMSRL